MDTLNPSPWRQRLSALPRETRDTWFLLALIAWTIAPHLPRLPSGLALLSGGVLLWRARLAWRQAPLPGRRLLLGVVGLALASVWISQHGRLGRDTAVDLLVLLMTLKTLELRARRDALVVFFLGFFLVLTQFLYSQSLITALAMGVSVWGWLTALTLAHMPAGVPRLRDAGALAARAAGLGVPVMVALFLLFPRLSPLWGVPAETARTGLSDHLQLGDIAELAQDDSIALRLRFMGPAPPPQALYFRGPVLSRYDGRQWLGADAESAGDRRSAVLTRGPGIAYEMTLEPLHIAWLPLLDLTPQAPTSLPALPDLRRGTGGQWQLRNPLSQRVRLQARAWPDALAEPQLSRRRQRELTALAPGHDLRTRAWAADFHARVDLRDADAAALSDAVLRYIRGAGFSYTLSPGRYGTEPVDAFWLDRRQGFCEHFAAAFVVVMRAMGVPARIVTGYQGSDDAPEDGYWVVRQSHAHAWAEVWEAGHGWLRVDPTAAVAPDRILHGRELQPAPGLIGGALEAFDPGLTWRLRRAFETLDNRWNQWVLGYGRPQQDKLLRALGLRDADPAALAQALGVLLAAVALAGAAWAAWDARRRTPWQRLQTAVSGELLRLGVEVPASASPGHCADRVDQACGDAGHAIAEALRDLQRMRYGPPAVAGAPQTGDRWRRWQRDFHRRCVQLRRPPARPR